MSEENGEKKYQPTATRLENLRKEGNFLRAREFQSGITLIGSLLILYFLNTTFYQTLSKNFRLIYLNMNGYIQNEESFSNLFKQVAWSNLFLLLPFFGGTILVFFMSLQVFGKLSFSKKLFQLKLERISPAKNLKRIFSMQNTVEIGKSILKLFLFLAILILFLQWHYLDIIHLAKINEIQSIDNSLILFEEFLIVIILGILVIGLVDALVNYHQYQKKAMMTHQEMKDENKDTEGNQDVKRKLRQVQQAIAMQSLQRDIPQATVIITNPTHYAVALRYKEGIDSAPKIVAKGVDHIASHIRILGVKHAVPIYEAPQLARAIYHTGKVGSFIHPELYMAIAIVLSYILQLKEYQLGRGQRPAPIEDLQIPDAFRFK